MSNMTRQLEALLFYEGGPIRKKDAARSLQISEEELSEVVASLDALLVDRGVVLVQADETLTLSTSPEASELIKEIRKEELQRPLSKQALETLAIILYRGPIGKPDIDYIRGVNSSTMLRTLLIRGLVDRAEEANSARQFTYSATTDLLRQIGLTKKEDLPSYDEIGSELSHVQDETATLSSGVEQASLQENSSAKM